MGKFILLAFFLSTSRGASAEERIEGETCHGANGAETCLDAGVVQGSSMLMTSKSQVKQEFRVVEEESDDAVAPFGKYLDKTLNVCYAAAEGTVDFRKKCKFSCCDPDPDGPKACTKMSYAVGQREKPPPCSDASNPDQSQSKLEEPTMMADYYYPKEGLAYPRNCTKPATGWPAIVGLHGRGGSRKSMKYLAEGFAESCFMFVPIDWNENKYAASDVNKFVNFLKEANSSLVDPDKIYLYGYSLGGQLATQIWFSDANKENYADGLAKAVIAAGVGANQMKDDVEPAKKRGLGSIKPLLMIGCDDDAAIDPSGADQTQEFMKKAGQTSYRFKYDGCGHYPMNDYRFYDDIVRWFGTGEDETLKEYYEKYPCKSKDDCTGQPKVRSGEWKQIATDKADTVSCDRETGLIQEMYMYKLEACQGKCLSTSECVAVDYTDRGKTCYLYSKACTTPTMEVTKQTSGNPVSWRFDKEDGMPSLKCDCNDNFCPGDFKKEKGKGKVFELKGVRQNCKIRACAGCPQCMNYNEKKKEYTFELFKGCKYPDGTVSSR